MPGYDICKVTTVRNNREKDNYYVCDMDVRKIWKDLGGDIDNKEFKDY